MKIGSTLLAVTLLLCLTQATAQDEGLYAPAPPADAAFVRVLHAAEGAGEVSPRVGDTDFGALSYGDVSPYRVVPQGTAELSAGQVTETLELAAGRFYTVVLNGAATFLEDPMLHNRARTLLVLYNASSKPVTLKTADGATEVIPDVPPGELGSVEVNPISVAFGVFAGNIALATFEELQLERGAVYSTFMLPDGTAAFVQNTTVTE
jgi:alginate O-acetyltransferase complex protein AlgF